MAALVTGRPVALLLSAVLVTFSVPAQEHAPAAYRLAAARADVPAAVLFAIALQESGVHMDGRLIPWPWTLNVGGESRRFPNRKTACADLLNALVDTLAKRIDVGLAQVNVGYHAHRIEQPCDLLDPYRNLEIAATILREQHVPGEDWLLAVGRYHRPAGGAPATLYRKSVEQHLLRAPTGLTSPSTSWRSPR